jgi:hypothetical protein
MTHSKHGTVVLMGSGEMAASMVETHKYALSLIEGVQKAVFMDTPAGFQLNADFIAEKAVEFFHDRIGKPLEIVSYKSSSATPDQLQAAMKLLHEASYVFAGPGSPTYAVKHWRQSPIPDALLETLSRGGVLTFASAAALTLGRLTVPVYEIYKVGDPVHWTEGLDILGHYGLDVCVVPHWNNNSGGDHDTTFCFLGEPRWQALSAELPDTTVVLGLDEHTACLIRFAENVCEVHGVGRVIVQRGGVETVFKEGDSFSIDVLRGGTSPSQAMQQPSEGVLTWTAIRARYESLRQMAAPPMEAISGYIYDLLSFMNAARAQGDQQMGRQAEEAVREALVSMANRPDISKADIKDAVSPFIDFLLELRTSLRDAKQWAQADAIRDRLIEMGIILEDTPQGTQWHQTEG